MNFVKIIFILLGTLSLLIGVIGIVVPGLPTTPFVLLTALLYAKSSDRLYQRLINNKLVGPYIAEYQARKGMTRKGKRSAIAILWVMIIISTVFFITALEFRIVIISMGLIGTVVMGFIVPTAKKETN